MEQKFTGRVWKLPDDVDTDTIIPGRYGVLPDAKAMSVHCMEPLRPELASNAKEGDVFVAGKNFGCGSSREQAPACIAALGVKCIIAKSFARIFYRNGINNGMLLIESGDIPDCCEDGDTISVLVNENKVIINGKSFSFPSFPDNVDAIIRDGGLVNRYRKLNEEKEANLSKGHTLAEKILMKNTGLSDLQPGQLITPRPDMCMVHDIYTPFVVQQLDNMKFKELSDPDKAVIILDHLMPTNQATGDPRHYRAGIELSQRFGIKKLHIGEGICHSLMHEKRYALPGTVVVATDSHTPTYGGGGCFCTGIGFTEMAATLGSGELWMKVPHAIKIVIEGKLPGGVYAKDIILKILGDIKSDGGTGKSMEFTGSAVRDLSMQSRFTIANMALEAGVKSALFEADKKTAEYFDMDLKEIDWIKIDENANYSQVLEYKAEDFAPQLSCPQGVDNVHPVDEVAGTLLNEVYIGSCTNGSIEDMKVAADILKGKKIAKYLKLVIIPATLNVYKEAIKLGYIRTFIEAGAMISHPCCGLCCGQPYGLMSDGEVVLGTNNRNFIGRMGTKKSLIYLSSPAVAAVSALKGYIADPREIQIEI
ncbi:aconitase/3-isopropylmalate dehydratase large subunit family protein [Sedimentibacter sp.]|uniref:aconitase/3-isopropylmalate dehydratase large subunit family protein n=1 Tax=Sedimentibacter sp. TaxID=1960295 RepID=UPI0028ACB476|nr:aconitase/3-isopropylmalate dehydratase large subunit family protein [Sedimentibacter sp.]